MLKPVGSDHNPKTLEWQTVQGILRMWQYNVLRVIKILLKFDLRIPRCGSRVQIRAMVDRS